jgi:DNA invertase Pin-like site-specific DNA recombinase
MQLLRTQLGRSSQNSSSTPAGGVSVVLAQDRDRFAREPAYHYLLKKEFEEHGCRLKALNDRGDDSPEGELTEGVVSEVQNQPNCVSVPC